MSGAASTYSEFENHVIIAGNETNHIPLLPPRLFENYVIIADNKTLVYLVDKCMRGYLVSPTP